MKPQVHRRQRTNVVIVERKTRERSLPPRRLINQHLGEPVNTLCVYLDMTHRWFEHSGSGSKLIAKFPRGRDIDTNQPPTQSYRDQ